MSRSDAASVLVRTVAVILLATACAQAADFYASPTGTAGGNGSIGNPWDLQTALNQPASVHAGDTLWLRNGTYTGLFVSNLNGTGVSPIKVRQYPGERATISGSPNTSQTAALQIEGGYTWFMDFEIISAGLDRMSGESVSWPDDINLSSGVNTGNNFEGEGAGCKVINLVIHDTATALSPWVHATDFETNGCLIYHIGWDAPDRGHGHGIYTQNNTGTKSFKNNVIWGGYQYGTQAYGSENAYINNMTFDGNTYFDAGIDSNVSGGSNLLIGGGRPSENIVVTNNTLYARGLNVTSLTLGYYYLTGPNVNATVTGNTIAGACIYNNWQTLTDRNNTIIEDNMLVKVDTTMLASLPAYDWNANTYYCLESVDRPFYWYWNGGNNWYFFPGWVTATALDSASSYTKALPTSLVTFVRPSDYESGRGTITVYNWPQSASVSVNVSSVLANGDTYEVRDAQNFYGTPVTTGTYSGSSISIPMTGTTAAQPAGNAPKSYTHTSSQFGCFILIKTDGGSAPAAPTGVSASDGTYSDRVRVSWTASGGAASYKVFRNAVNNSATAGQIGVSAEVTYDDTSAVVGSTYYYWVKATNGAGDSGFSNSDSGYRSTSLSFVLYLEAESGTLTSPMSVSADPTASNGQYISTATTNTGTAQYTINAPSGGDYVVWGRVYCAGGSTDSCFVSVDGGSEDVYDMAENVWAPKWQWTVVNGRGGGAPDSIHPRLFTLAAGSHTFTFRGRDAHSKLDRLCFANDPAYVPFDSTANNPPVAVDDSAATSLDLDVLIPVLDNDSDPDQDALTIESVTTPGHGEATINVDDTITYTPDANYVGDDSFDYTISDGHGGTDTATVTVTIGALSWALTVTSSPIIDVAVSGTQGCGGMTNYAIQCEPGASVSLTAPLMVLKPDKTYYFVRWSVGGVAQTGGQAAAGFDVNADMFAAALYKSVSAIQISGPRALYEKTRGRYRCTALFSDGSSKAVTGVATWQTGSKSLRLAGAGVFDARPTSRTVTRKITARYGGVTGSFNVKIRNR